ncbi:MAG TPA: DUF2852 domain-containing protein [Xanthobacteraceae bacterium]|nr:DUF2852 domain-containing protein [Xanthobacteraceae bacterium]
MSCNASAANASAASWNTGTHRCRPPGRGLEIAAIILGFFFFWPAALGYLVWKLMGYPVPNEVKTFFENNFTRLSQSFRGRPHFSSTGNFAFEEYRRRELERLEAERRRLDDEARGFAEFVEELKRAKDREEFDAFMARRRAAPAAG